MAAKKKPPKKAARKPTPEKKSPPAVIAPALPVQPSYTEITEAITLMVLRKMSDTMNVLQKSALQALATAAAALAASAQALAASADEPPAKAAPAPKAAPPPADEPPTKAAPAPKAAPKAPPKAAPPPSDDTEPLPTKARRLAGEYAGKHGREGLKAILVRYTQGSLADVPAEKLLEIIAEFSGESPKDDLLG
jgi:hypothetical protein